MNDEATVLISRKWDAKHKRIRKALRANLGVMIFETLYSLTCEILTTPLLQLLEEQAKEQKPGKPNGYQGRHLHTRSGGSASATNQIDKPT